MHKQFFRYVECHFDTTVGTFQYLNFNAWVNAFYFMYIIID